MTLSSMPENWWSVMLIVQKLTNERQDATTKRIAETLGKAPESASAIIHNIRNKDLLDIDARTGVRSFVYLTDQGYEQLSKLEAALAAGNPMSDYQSCHYRRAA